jgi:hypothetical protein
MIALMATREEITFDYHSRQEVLTGADSGLEPCFN